MNDLPAMMSWPQLTHRLRFAGQVLRRPTVAVIGGYHGGNLGDLALGRVTQRALGGRRSALQTIYSLDKWPRTRIGVVGGGAVIGAATLACLMRRFSHSEASLAVVGVDVLDLDHLEGAQEFLSKIAYFSVRSTYQADQIRSRFGIDQVRYHPDICFLLKPRPHSRPHGMRTFGFNLCGQFPQKDAARCKEDTVSSERLIRAHYERIARAVMNFAIDQGCIAIHVPFTPQDDAVARRIFTDMPVRFRRYYPNPANVFNIIGQCDLFFASRFHSLVFALLNRTPVIPFLYARKSYRLLDDLQVKADPFLGRNDLHDWDSVCAKLHRLEHQIISLPEARLLDLRRSVRSEFALVRERLGLFGTCYTSYD